MDGDVFDAVADRYDAARPGYPDAAIDAMLELAGTTPDADVLEIGAGTGQLSVELRRRGFRLTCLEPGEALAAALRRKLSAGARVIVSRFEDWDPAGSRFDLVVAATSFHWLQPELAVPKIRRLLRAEGALGLIWNEHVSSGPDDPFERLIQPIYDAIAPGLEPHGPPPTADRLPDRRDALRDQGIGRVERRQVPWQVSSTSAELIDLLSTYSNHLALDPATRRRLFAALREAVDGLPDGRIVRQVLTDIYVVRAADLG